MKNDVVLNKVSTIERCLNRVKEVYEQNPDTLQNFTKQDSMVLNIQRACEASIDLAMHIIAAKKLGLPQTSREAFDLLESNGIIRLQTAKQLKAMVGFRNIAVHDYQNLNIAILQQIIENHLNDFTDFTKQVLLFNDED